MNQYLSREEKEHFVRATALAALLENTIDSYAGAKSTDPHFLKSVRMGRTMISTALTMRSDALESEAKAEFARQVSKLEFICVPTPEAKKAYAELIALKTTIPMSKEDFENWYCAVIETTCKTCYTDDYKECPIRSVLTKYGVYPIDPAAIGKCQYSYIGTGELDKPEPALEAEQVPAGRYNLAVGEYQALEQKVNEEYLPRISQLEDEIENAKDPNPQYMQEINTLHEQAEKNAGIIKKLIEENTKLSGQVQQLEEKLQTAAAAQEQVKEEYPVSLGLASGGEFDYVLPARMAEIMIREIQQPKHSRGTCAQYVGGKLVAIDLQEVVALHVDKLPQGDWVRNKAVQSVAGPQERYRVECKCGAEYFADMNAGRTKAWCRECKTTVFADRQADPVSDPLDGIEATLLTNRYWVERDPQSPAPKKEAVPFRSIGKNYGKDYTDPCNPLAADGGAR